MMHLKYMILNTDSAAEEILKNWKHDDNTLEFWRASSNFIYVFKYCDENYFLRFSHEDERSIEQIRAELDFLEYLHDNKYPCVSPVKSKKGNFIETVKTEIGTYYAVAFNEVKGKELDIEEMSMNYFEKWGKSLATLHNLSMKYKPKKYIRENWKNKLEYIRGILKDLPQEKSALEEVERVEKYLNSIPVDYENYGLIHYDFELDNVLWDDKSNGYNIIDFDDAVYHWYVMDIVSALRDLKELEKNKKEVAMKLFLKGYRSIKNIDDKFIDMTPKFERYSNLLSFAILMRAMKDNKFEDPDWLVELRPRFIKKCDEYRKGFEKY